MQLADYKIKNRIILKSKQEKELPSKSTFWCTKLAPTQFCFSLKRLLLLASLPSLLTCTRFDLTSLSALFSYHKSQKV